MNYIIQDITNSNATDFIYKPPTFAGSEKVSLVRGKESFQSCAEILQQTPILKPLILKQEISIEIPDEKQLQTDRNFVNKQFSDKKQEFHLLIDESAFHYDLSSTNAEVSLILQLVDDESAYGKRRKNLLNEMFRTIGVTNKVSKDGDCCSYFVLAVSIK